jgi:hypothetical protein
MEQLLIERHVVVRHDLGGETAFEHVADAPSIKRGDLGDGRDGGIFGFNDPTSDTILDHFRHGATRPRDHRRATGHGFDHHQPERLGQSIGNSNAKALPRKAPCRRHRSRQ